MSEYPHAPANSSGTEIVRRSSSLPEKISYAEHLAQSGLLPSAYRRQPANVLYAIEYGEMLGLAPLAAITGLHIIDGKPTASAGMVSALVREAGHRLRNGYDKKTGVGWCEIVRCDDPEFTYRVEWTLARAVIAELCELKNGKPYARSKLGKPTPWELYPEAMLKARAITECAREACEEALNGVHYTPEELGAEVDESGEPIRVTAERADQPATPAEEMPNWEEELAAAAGDVDALKALYKRAGERDPGNTKLAERLVAAGKAAKAQADAAVVDAVLVTDPNDARAEAHKEIHELLTKVGVRRFDHEALLSGMVGRRVVAVGQLDDPATASVLEELRNLAVLDKEMIDTLLGEAIRAGEPLAKSAA